MKLATTTQTEDKIQQFIALVFKGMEAWLEAGKIVAALIDEDAEAVDKIVEKCPNISPEMVIRFEQIGRKQLCPKLLLFDGPGPKRLRRLPFDLQEKFADEPVEMLVKTPNGWDTLKVDIRNMSPDQAAQVFSNEGVRSPQAQRAFIEDRAAKKVAPPVENNMPYRIVGRKIVFMEACTISAGDIAKILAEIETK